MDELLHKLEGGDMRSIGCSDEVVAEVLAAPARFEPLFQGLYHADPRVRMRAADALEKISARHPEYLAPYNEALLGPVAASEQQEVRWHVAQMLPRLDLTPAERRVALAILLEYLDDRSKIVKTFAMQAMAELAEQDPALRPAVLPLLKELAETGSPAMRSRGRKLLRRLDVNA